MQVNDLNIFSSPLEKFDLLNVNLPAESSSIARLHAAIGLRSKWHDGQNDMTAGSYRQKQSRHIVPQSRHLLCTYCCCGRILFSD